MVISTYRHLLGHRPVALLLSGQAISTAGDMFYAVALPWLVLGHGTARDLSLVLAAYAVPRAGMALAGGWLSDRLRPRRVMLLADALRAGLVGLLAALTWHGQPTLGAIITVAIPLGACEGLFLPASFAIMPDLVAAPDLATGNALNATTVQLANLIGPALGGAFVAALHPGPALLVDALSFVVSALSLWLIRSHASPPTPSIAETARPEAANFWQLLRGWRLLQVALVIIVVGNLTVGGTLFVALPTLAHGPLRAGAGGYGALLAAFGAGALVGGIVAGRASTLPPQAVVILLLTLVQAAALATLPLAGGVLGACGILVVAGLATGLTNVLYLTLVQREAPPALLGQIMGIFAFASLGLYPLSVGLAGIVITRYGPGVMFPLTGGAIAAAVTFGLAQREIRVLGAPAAPPSEPQDLLY